MSRFKGAIAPVMSPPSRRTTGAPPAPLPMFSIYYPEQGGEPRRSQLRLCYAKSERPPVTSQLSHYSRCRILYTGLLCVSGGVAGVLCRWSGLAFRGTVRVVRPPSEAPNPASRPLVGFAGGPQCYPGGQAPRSPCRGESVTAEPAVTRSRAEGLA